MDSRIGGGRIGAMAKENAGEGAAKGRARERARDVMEEGGEMDARCASHGMGILGRWGMMRR